MTAKTRQMNMWSGDFGRSYTDRNPHTPEAMDELYRKNFGVTRSELNAEFLNDFDRSIRILEVGSNVGTQGQILREMGFNHVFGIELQIYAIQEAKKCSSDITSIQASAFNIPFKAGAFDIVYTSGVLIHISPNDIEKALCEIKRVSARYIWGFEYYANTYTEINYRGKKGLLWKANFAYEYLRRFSGYRLIHERKVTYMNSKNIDQMFLLENSNA
jgi:pseudaminic acid biosynthesis-associated methylase